MKVFVTGAAGFSGRHLCACLAGIRATGVECVGLVRRDRGALPAGTRTVTGDLLEKESMAAVVREVVPDCTVHLAGALRGNPDALLTSNAAGTANLIEAHRRHAPGARIIVVSSSAVYGDAGEGPIPEDTPFRPVSAYGESKVAQERIALDAALDGLSIAIVRPFNLAGPGQPAAFVIGRIVEDALAVERGDQEAVRLGSLAPRRDYVDVRDAVRAYWLLAAHPAFDAVCAGRAFNVGSGRPTAVRDLLTICEEVRGRRYPLRLDEHPAPDLVPTQTADTRAIAAAVGWQPRYTLRQTMQDMFAEAEAGHAKRTGC